VWTLFPDIRGNSLSFSPFMCLLYLAFLISRYIPNSFRLMFLSQRHVKFCQTLLCIYWNDHVIFLVFYSVYVLYYSYWTIFLSVEWKQFDSDVVFIHGNGICKYFMRIFALKVIKEIASNFLFCLGFYTV
jgi:hypothetical protein